MNYLIKFDENGKRTETYVREEKTEAQINKLLANGFLAISETEYQLLIGNIGVHQKIGWNFYSICSSRAHRGRKGRLSIRTGKS